MTDMATGDGSGIPTTLTEPATDRGRRPPFARTLPVVGAATVVAFMLSSAWYIAFAEPLALLGSAADSSMPAWIVPVELGRSLVIATVLAAAVQRLAVTTRSGALVLALAVWAAFPGVLLLGSVVHEGEPPLLAAIHAGDWLLKLVVITMMVRRLGARGSTSRS